MRVIIVGGVAGGAGTAARLRRRDESAEIILCERGEFISFANCGLPYYIGGVIEDKTDLTVQTPESFRARFNVDVRTLTEAVSVDTDSRNVMMKDLRTGRREAVRYDSLVLSPGSAPVRPSIPGADRENVFTLRNIPDSERILAYIETARPSTCAVIGAGFIGLEMAENLNGLGIQVSVVEAGNHVIPAMDGDMTGAVHAHLRRRGIRLRTGAFCKEIQGDGIVLEDETRIPADMVILSVGVSPGTAFLQGSGIKLGSRGEIIVDSSLRTNLPGVYALGDAATVSNLVSNRQTLIPLAGPANKQARIVADNICGGRSVYRGSLGTAIIKLDGMTVACTGLNESFLSAEKIPYRKSVTISSHHASYYPGGETMTIKLLFSPDGKILGAQVVGGKGVDKRIDTMATVLGMGGTVYDLQELELAYAPPFSSAKDPVNMAGFAAGNMLEGTLKAFYAEDIENLPADAVFIDVRDPDEYANGHIPGTMNIPLNTLRERLEELPRDKTIHLTCQIGLRGYIAQRILEQEGFDSRNLSGGYAFYQCVENA